MSKLYIHNGVFHADDVVAAAAAIELGLIKDEYQIFRTRDLSEVTPVDLVVDVGEGPYDHHGATAGKTFCFNGEEIPHCGLTLLLEATVPSGDFALYLPYIVNVALTDNGKTADPRYPSPFSFVNAFNVMWDAKGEEGGHAQFFTVLDIARQVFRRIRQQVNSAKRAAKILDSTDWNQDVVEIPAGLPGWQEHAVPAKARFVVFEGNIPTPWFLQCVPDKVGSFGQKTPHPETWRGKRGADLIAASGVEGAIFCHAGGFISGWDTKEHALEAARKLV